MKIKLKIISIFSLGAGKFIIGKIANITKPVIFFIPNTIQGTKNTLEGISESVDTVVKISEKVDKGFVMGTKIFGATSGASLLAKGSVDLAESVKCADGVCATVSAVGCCLDIIQMATSWVPGPNYTATVAVPLSIGCKTFVWLCKKSEILAWGCRSQIGL